MTFEIYITEKQKKILKSLDKKIEDQIFKKLEQLSENPELGKPLSHELSGCRSLHIGNYRVIYEFKSDKIYILSVGHRKYIYTYFNPETNSEFTNVLKSPQLKIYYITAGKETNDKKFMKFIKEKLDEYETIEDIEYVKKIRKKLKKEKLITEKELLKELNLE
ncbi:MAG TPA: type II toxin-antitoxin system RelE/ParE family toxin [archaeon]|nr:type II toxin-antitoxin system RelE/ParE family toxin [archaeon]HPV65871.1 type II toxin-antitoxin system RelE/ParE family toxin [archaeon]HRS42498.1 type II toxin-antitoxin system RelE/ParE family toxin [Candidatus Diapherotrites archaeon]